MCYLSYYICYKLRIFRETKAEMFYLEFLCHIVIAMIKTEKRESKQTICLGPRAKMNTHIPLMA